MPKLALSHCPGKKSSTTSGSTFFSTQKYWSGYLAQGTSNTVTCVEVSWVEPRITCPPAFTAASDASIWAGIDGYDGRGISDKDQRFEQAGSDAYCTTFGPAYTAWTYAKASTDPYHETPFSISGGDVIWSQVTASGHNFRMSIADLTIGRIMSQTATVKDATREAAEWLVQGIQSGCPKRCATEDLAQFKSVPFSGAEATIGGVLGSVSHWFREILTMGSGSIRRATVSPLSHGGSFTVTWRHR